MQKAARWFYETEIKPEAVAAESTGDRPSQDLLKKMGSEGVELTAMRLGPGRHLHGRKMLGGVKGEEYDYFHELVLAQETGRIGAYSRGFQDALLAGEFNPCSSEGSRLLRNMWRRDVDRVDPGDELWDRRDEATDHATRYVSASLFECRGAEGEA